MTSRSLRFALAAFVAMALGSAGCVNGSTDPGTAKDSCRLRDCGASSGNSDGDDIPVDDAFDEDTDFFPPDDAPATDAAPDATLDTGATDSAGETGSGCGTPAAGGACTVLPQCGCMAGDACDVPGTDGKTVCVAAGSKGLHERCKSLGECQKGLTCNFELCVPFCNAAGDCSGADRCDPVQYDGGDAGVMDIPGLKTCQTPCDPMSPSTTCGPTASCWFLDSAKGITSCVGAGASTIAGSCKSDSFNCAPGYVCIGAGDCRKWCRIGHPADCASGKTCNAFSDHPTVSGYEYGYCL